MADVSIWDKFPNLTRTELRTLTAVTCQELMSTEEGRQRFSHEFLQISPAAAAAQLAALAGTDAVDELCETLEDEDAARAVCLGILDEVRKTPVLGQRVAAAYDDAQRTMSAELLLLAGAIAILAIKIRRLRWDKSGMEIVFDKSSDAVRALIAALPFKP